MTFTKPEQDKHRKAFIDECRQKSWGAACHADWISKGVDDVMADAVTFKYIPAPLSKARLDELIQIPERKK